MDNKTIEKLARVNEISERLIYVMDVNGVAEDDAIPALGQALVTLVMEGERMSRDHFVAWITELYDALNVIADAPTPTPMEDMN